MPPQTPEHRRLRVAIIHQPWSRIEPPVTTADSIALWSDEIARRIAQVCDVTCYCAQYPDQPTTQSVNNVEYRRFPTSIDRWVKAGMDKLDELGLRRCERPFYSSCRCYRQFINAVREDLKRLKPDVVHIQNFSQFVLLVREALPEAEIILHMHYEWLAQIDDEWIGPRLAEADSIIFCSNYFADQTRRAWPQFAGRCRTVYDGVTLSAFEPASVQREDPKRLLFVGRISPDKGVHVLVEAFEQVLAKHPTARLRIIGPVETLPKSHCLSMAQEQIVKDLARFYGRPYVDQLRELMSPAVAKQIDIVGHVSRPELIKEFKQAGVLVLPSIYPEGFGIPIVEAGACFTPAVCTRRGGMPEVVVDDETGLLVPVGDASSLAAAINRLLDNETLRQSMGTAAHARVTEHFTWDRIADSLLAEYCRIAGRVTETCARIVPPRPMAAIS